MGIFILFVLLAGASLLGYLSLRAIFRALGSGIAPSRDSISSTRATRHGASLGGAQTSMSAEEEGNAHSGPFGYSPNTPYTQTQYGSLFDSDAEWKHEEQ